MGFFAVLKDSSDNPFEVIQCHLNLWSLAGLLGRRTFFWDVGLWLKADKGTVTSFQLALPFGTERTQMKDLHDHVLNQSIAQLIFGKPVNIQPSAIDWGYGPIDVAYVIKGIKEQSEKGFSRWKFSLNPPPHPKRETILSTNQVRTAKSRTSLGLETVRSRENGSAHRPSHL